MDFNIQWKQLLFRILKIEEVTYEIRHGLIPTDGGFRIVDYRMPG
ncbi:hypothetical protein [Paenibacillus urinalis]